MKRHVTRGFTLVELLVVITIVAILVVMIMPAFSSAWQTAQLTRCKRNLNTLYTAYGVWRQDRETKGWDARLQGEAWRGELLSYVEGDRTVFVCQSRGMRSGEDPAAPTTPPVTPDPGGGGEGGGGSGGGGGEGGGTTPPVVPPTPPDPEDYAFTFNIYLQQGAIEGVIGSPGQGINGPYDVFIRALPLGSHPYVRKTQYSDHIRYEADDCGIGITGDADITCDIYYSDGVPTKVAVIYGSGSGTDSATHRYIYDFLVCGQVFVKRWQTHYGQTFPLQKPEKPGDFGYTPGASEFGGDSWGGGTGGAGSYGDPSNTPPFVLPLRGDYALSRGTYETVTTSSTRTFQSLDAKLFFILDYPKAVADYTPGSTEGADWQTYFIQYPELWDNPNGGIYKKGPGAAEGRPWQFYQSLRHFGGANMLFGDGHVETLQPDELRTDNAAWYHRGR